MALTASAPSTFEPAEIRRALSILIEPGSTFELRGLPSRQNWAGRDLDAAAGWASARAARDNLYYTLNPCRPDLSGAAKNHDITGRARILIDVDSIRPDADRNATDDERQAAWHVSDLVMLHLAGLGFPSPVVVDSGNGFQLIYRCNLPNGPLESQRIAALYKLLNGLYATTGARIDEAVHNAARIARLPGTVNRKGPSTADRPHRPARLLTVPDPFEAIDAEAFARVAVGRKPKPAASKPIIAREPDSDPVAAWFAAALRNEADKVAGAIDGTRHEQLKAGAATLFGLVHHGYFTAGQVQAELTLSCRRCGLPDDEAADLIAWAREHGQARPLAWPDSIEKPAARPARKPAEPKAEPEPAVTTGASGRGYKFPLIVRGCDVESKQVDWFWPERIPFGFLTLFAGRTGIGKSFVTLDVAARATVGEEIPECGGMCFEQTDVLIISEDSHEYILAPRLIEAGADMTRISFMSWEAMADFELADRQMLDDTYQAAGCPKLIVIDPPTNFLGGKDEHKNAEVRSVLMQCSIWSMQNHAAVLLITHCNKAVRKDVAALDRIIGSVAWASTSRIAHVFAPHPDERDQGVFVPLKTNIGRKAEAISYEIVSTGPIAHVEWRGKIDLEADDAMSGENKKPRGVQAIEFLADAFTRRREWDADELRRVAAEAGVSKNALWSPEVQALPIRKRQVVGANGDRKWIWIAETGWPPENDREPGNLGT